VSRSTVIVLQAGRGGLRFLQTADSILRSRRPAARTVIALSPEYPRPALIDSVTARLTASVISSPDAARLVGDDRYVLFLRSGYMLDDICLEELEAALDDDASAVAVAPSIRLQTPDAMAHLVWTPAATTAREVLNDTRGVPPVFAVRGEAYERLGGLDRSFAELAEYELWLRLMLAGHKIAVLEEPLVARDISGPHAGTPYTGHQGDARHLELFRGILQKHSRAIQLVMHDVLVGREVRFGQLREQHRELIAARDAGLAELERLRAEAAHLRAYLAHHGQSAVDWGDLDRTHPISRDWGYDRGIPIDRRYINDFLRAHSSDVRGLVLEVQEDEFTRAYGGAKVSTSTVLDVDASNARATLLADLRCAPGIPSNHFDCIILTQTLHVIDDMSAVLRECHRILKPGGVLLATIPSASRVCLEYGRDGDFWRATPAGARALFHSAFTPGSVTVEEFGNVRTNVAFLEGVATTEIPDAEFEPRDPYFPALTGIRARKGAAAPRRGGFGVVLLYHRIEEHWGIHDLAVPAALFEAQLDWLRRECHVLPLEELLATASSNLPDRAVALTFDDGYVDNLTTAAPLLQKYGLPATFFLTTRGLEDRTEYWWDLLERVMLATPGVPSSFAVEIGGKTETLSTGTNEERLVAHGRLHDIMVHAMLQDRDAVVARLRSWGGAGVPRARPMVADEMRQLLGYANVTIGAHTVNHLALPDQGADAVLREIHDSCAALTRLAGKPVDIFAYPYGACDRVSAAVVRRSCRWGVTCDQRVLGESFDAAAVPRMEVKRWDWLELASRLEPLFHPRQPSARRAVGGP